MRVASSSGWRGDRDCGLVRGTVRVASSRRRSRVGTSLHGREGRSVSERAQRPQGRAHGLRGAGPPLSGARVRGRRLRPRRAVARRGTQRGGRAVGRACRDGTGVTHGRRPGRPGRRAGAHSDRRLRTGREAAPAGPHPVGRPARPRPLRTLPRPGPQRPVDRAPGTLAALLPHPAARPLEPRGPPPVPGLLLHPPRRLGERPLGRRLLPQPPRTAQLTPAAAPLVALVEDYDPAALLADSTWLQPQWTATALGIYQNWFPHTASYRFTPVLDLAYLAHALFMAKREFEAREVLTAMGPYASRMPWSAFGDPEERLTRARRSCGLPTPGPA